MSGSLCFLIERVATPIGELLVIADAAGALHGIEWADRPTRVDRLLRRGSTLWPAEGATVHGTALSAYFAGELAAIDALPVAPAGTFFQRSVWNEVRQIPAGTTLSYGALARRIARHDAARAVGFANGANPVAIVVPCHRLVGSDGSLTGYGGGLERKRWLLEHERCASDRSSPGRRHRPEQDLAPSAVLAFCSKRSVHDQRLDETEPRMAERLRHATDDFEPDA